jgi:diaminopropionate ammonia-lyase
VNPKRRRSPSTTDRLQLGCTLTQYDAFMETPDDPAVIFRDVWGDNPPTSLLDMPILAQQAGVAKVLVKAENERPLGNFKSLGGTVASLRALARVRTPPIPLSALRDCGHAGRLPRLLCASDGNHGLAVASAARYARTTAAVYLPAGASKSRAARIEATGARVRWVSGTYDDAVLEAAKAAANGEGLLVPDTSADQSDQVVRDVLDGYSVLTREIVAQMRHQGLDGPSHVFVQAGVGGLAAAMAIGLRNILQEPRALIIVEPSTAACLTLALVQGHPQRLGGDLQTCAEMLSCGLASASAVDILRPFHPISLLVNEEELAAAPARLFAAGGPATTPSGAAGIAGFLHAATRSATPGTIQLNERSVVLLVATEGPLADKRTTDMVGGWPPIASVYG